MLNFNNTHIFTGYLKQLLSSINLPSCRIYTLDFKKYKEENFKEDPRVIKSFNAMTTKTDDNSTDDAVVISTDVRIPYLKDDRVQTYFFNKNTKETFWNIGNEIIFDKDKMIPGLTKTLNSPGITYDTKTHEYLGDFLRFLRDYYNLDLMSLYNCFNNKIYTNIYFSTKINKPIFNPATNEWHLNSIIGPKLKLASLINPSNFNPNQEGEVSIDSKSNKWIITQRNQRANNSTNIDYFKTTLSAKKLTFDSNDTQYKIYAIPVKLFSNYTIALECPQEIELFCGLYKTSLDGSEKAIDLFNRTYQKINSSIFAQPFIYDKLDVKYWSEETKSLLADKSKISRYDVALREQDLKLFIKVPALNKSTITILEGNYLHFNDCIYKPTKKKDLCSWRYQANHSILNFNLDTETNLNTYNFKPISKLQLLAFNNYESYPFSDRLIEYLCGSVITQTDGIADNIKRAQKVMMQNGHNFMVSGLWEPKMQKIAYDYLMNSGPIEIVNTTNINTRNLYENKEQPDKYYILGLNQGTGKREYFIKKESRTSDREILVDKREGRKSKSNLYDVLGYIDKNIEKAYASRAIRTDNIIKEDGTPVKKVVITDTIQNVDIYGGLFDIQ